MARLENKAVIIAKYNTIEKCINRINEEYQDDPNSLTDYRKNDMIVLNLERACEACIDIAMYVISKNRLGIPQQKREAFEILEEHRIIDSNLCNNLKNMVGFRNIAIHDYTEVEIEILQEIIDNHLSDLLEFARIILNL